MKAKFAALAAGLALSLADPAPAALAVGDQVPDFSVPAVQGERPATLSLSALLRQGPVVLFVMPYVFNSGSDRECGEVADAFDRFGAAGASVVGMTRDPLDALAHFSSEACAGKIAMASAGVEVVTALDVNDDANFATRTTYVIAPGGRIVFVHDDDDWRGHVQAALAFVGQMRK